MTIPNTVASLRTQEAEDIIASAHTKFKEIKPHVNHKRSLEVIQERYDFLDIGPDCTSKNIDEFRLWVGITFTGSPTYLPQKTFEYILRADNAIWRTFQRQWLPSPP